ARLKIGQAEGPCRPPGLFPTLAVREEVEGRVGSVERDIEWYWWVHLRLTVEPGLVSELWAIK
ncbi:hypothetical protein A2U01_0114782, partial [Trifolium medium]|nr:hypothetical protein [Trifolium medium]